MHMRHVIMSIIILKKKHLYETYAVSIWFHFRYDDTRESWVFINEPISVHIPQRKGPLNRHYSDIIKRLRNKSKRFNVFWNPAHGQIYALFMQEGYKALTYITCVLCTLFPQATGDFMATTIWLDELY